MAYSSDVGNGVIRIDHVTMDLLNMSPGDFVEVSGEDGRGGRRTVARLSSLSPKDEGKGRIRIDSLTRYNLGLGTPRHEKADKDTVIVKKIKVVPAEKVVVVPTSPIPYIKEGYLVEVLENMPLIKGDDVTVRYFGGVLSFHVTDVTPDDVVVISQKTVFHIDGACLISNEEWDEVKKPWNHKQMR
jgi:transitional endoplasmic reticulum ATPase